jgi:hypothetical protein
LKNGIRVEMDLFNLIVVKEYAEEIACREAESALEEGGKHHNLICIGCGEIFASDRVPLQHGVIQEKVICNELANLAFICSERLEEMRVWGGHGRKEDSLRREIKVSEEAEIAKKTMRNGGNEKSY